MARRFPLVAVVLLCVGCGDPARVTLGAVVADPALTGEDARLAQGSDLQPDAPAAEVAQAEPEDAADPDAGQAASDAGGEVWPDVEAVDTETAEVADALEDATVDVAAPDAADAAVDASADSSATALPVAVTGCDPVYLGGAPTGTCETFVETWTCPGGAQFQGMVAMPDGGAVLAGGLAGQAWVVRTDGLGKVVWQKTFEGVGQARAVTLTTNGDIALSGSGPEIPNDLYWPYDSDLAYLLEVGPLGEFAWLQTWNPLLPSPARGRAEFLVALADGGLAVAGPKETSGGVGAIWLSRLDSKGKPVVETLLGNELCGGEWCSTGPIPIGLAVLADGRLLVRIKMHYGAGVNPDGVAVLDSSGAIQWTKLAPASELQVLPDGGFVASPSFNGFSGVPVVERYDGDGQMLWSTIWVAQALETPWWVMTLAALLDGDVSVTTTPKLKESFERFSRLDAQGQIRWQRALPFGAASAAADSGSGIVVMGYSGTTAFLMRTDRWGNTACADSTACAGKGWSFCDDGNPCTSDLCGAGGCSHASLDDGTSCGGGKTCAGGVCGP